MPDAKKTPKKSATRHFDILGIMLFVLACFVGLTILIGLIVSTKKKIPSNVAQICTDTTLAIAHAESLVAKNLQNPKSALFVRDSSAGLLYKGNCTYLIWGPVVSRNGFGAMNATQYRIRLHYKTASNFWAQQDLSILSK